MPEGGCAKPAQVVLKKAHNYADIGTDVHNKITEFAGRGFRALGVAITPDDGVHGARSPTLLRRRMARVL